MKYKVLKNTVANGARVQVGDIVELSQQEAHVLLGYGRIAVYTESSSDFTSEIRIAEAPAVEHRDPVMPAKRGRPPRGR